MVSPFPTTQVQITEDTGKARKGRIIFDPSRGTEFWEVIEKESQKAGWFNIEWLSTNPLPFSMIRGIRNPWNMNREVKICRDGTEVEPSVGITLLEEFEKRGGSNGMWM
ncbi:putative ATP-dependent RNA helicase [Neolecta irregularis DAH-3]|uniref:Putative ATP-dependent RNA helicase n=1 Tax=Neolecta irregularis (strain DAH-3) TaxID=1198029 RepID=A0A1U7LS80_NEOID|nr:putative ATP-dependent RNA helicase [Neolecta irregularis DAH-3]|eukprot:OLL25525.1 putative ATP-dependent RNA helicase [Neolecta irregularis DAH-3]